MPSDIGMPVYGGFLKMGVWDFPLQTIHVLHIDHPNSLAWRPPWFNIWKHIFQEEQPQPQPQPQPQQQQQQEACLWYL